MNSNVSKAILLCQFAARYISSREAGTNFNNFFVSQFGHSAFFAISRYMTTFFNHVFNVVDLRSKKKMIRSDTRRIVASMQYVKAFWVGIASKLPRSVCGLYSPSVYTKLPIAATTITNPQPASVWTVFVNLLPKSFLVRSEAHFPRARETAIISVSFCNPVRLNKKILATIFAHAKYCLRIHYRHDRLSQRWLCSGRTVALITVRPLSLYR